MFVKLINEPLFLELEGETILVPDDEPIDTASRIWEMCGWIISEFEKDCAEVKIFDKQGRPITRKTLDDFVIRNSSRTMAYVNQIRIMQGILERSLENLMKKLPGTLPDYIFSFMQTMLEDMKYEATEILFHRNKVAAHPAYIKPYPDDSEADVLASLLCWGGSYGFRDRSPLSFCIGSMIPVVNGVNANREIYSFSLHPMHEQMKDHFSRWEFCLEELADMIEHH